MAEYRERLIKEIGRGTNELQKNIDAVSELISHLENDTTIAKEFNQLESNISSVNKALEELLRNMDQGHRP